MSTWPITGASSGLGAALARAVVDRGDNVVVTARNITAIKHLADTHPDTVLAAPLDATDHDQVVAVMKAVASQFGSVDVLVNNAGHGYRAAVEEAMSDDVEELFATNFFGPIDLIQQVLPHMRERRSGTIINVSSIGAVVSNPGSGHYTATKVALEGLSDALNREVAYWVFV
ncbi:MULTISPECIES: SDR family NAD(P)-dependent oxidoreductase [Corynebacterium]|uniref:SDR family NAD(P)-dependent oxidoreductase n=1 Tax=Corynebacterium TaxID=1716 RepID=UPI00257FA65D|nr:MULTISPECIES: SDR family NAD(P)-dependent oxidoreductase [Corynebacterium]